VTISELKLEVEDVTDLFGSLLEAAGGGSIAVDSIHRRTLLSGIPSFMSRPGLKLATML
jgi:hypothetical protein